MVDAGQSGVKYVRRNMWTSMRFTDDADLNRQSLQWCDAVANARVHGTTHRVPWEMLAEESPHLEVWPESHWPDFALRPADVFHSYTAW